MPWLIPHWPRRVCAAWLLFFGCAAASAVPPTWIANIGNASVGTNWSTLKAPGLLDHVTIASGNVTFGASTAYGALDFSGGNLNGNATLTLGTVAGSTWTGGSMTFSSGGGVTVTSGAALTISGSTTDHDFGGTVLTNVGTVNWTGGRLVSGNGGAVTNSATWNDTASSDVTNDLGGSSVVFTNASGATYNKSGPGQTNFYVPFNNAGGVAVSTGTLALQGGGASTGNISIGDGAAVQISGDYGFNGGTLDATGTGNVAIATGTTTFANATNGSANIVVSGGNATFTGTHTGTGKLSVATGGTVNGTGTAQFGSLDWSGGTLAGNVTVANGNFSGGGKSLTGGSLTLTGNTSWDGSGISASAGSITNGGNATFSATGDGVLTNSGNATFTNAGTLSKNGGTGETEIQANVTNTGTIGANSGTLRLSGGGNSSNAVNVGDGATVKVTDHDFAITGGSLNANGTTGNGTIELASATTTFSGGTSGNANLLVDGGTATFNGTHAGTGKLSVATGGTVNGNGSAQFGSLNWSGGTVAGNVTVANGNFSGGGKNLTGGSLTLTGNTSWDGSGISASAGSITNGGNATFSATGDGVLTNSGNATFTNAGTLSKNGGTGETEIQANVTNTGTIGANSGTLRLSGGGNSSNAVNVGDGATVKITDHDFAITGGSLNANGTSGNGTIELASATTTFTNSTAGTANVLVDGGTATFNGTHAGTGKLSVATGGTVNGTGTAQFGSLNWSGGTVAGNVTVANANLNGGAKTLYGGNLTLTGTTGWDGTALSSNAGGRITNAAGAMFSVTNDGTLTNLGNATLVNAGTLAKNGGTGVTEIQAGVTNNGSVAVNTGSLRLTNGMANGAASTITVASGAELDWTNGATFAAGSQLGGGGVARLASGVLEANNTISVASFIFDGGQLAGTNHFAGTVGWNAGDWSASSGASTTIDSAGMLQIGSASQHDFNSRSIVNNGTVEWNAGDLRSGNGGAFTNGGTVYDANAGTASLQSSTFGGPFSFTNTGSYIKSGAGTTTIAVPFTNNSGTVKVTSGTLVFSSTYTHTGGNFFVGTGATAQFSNGLHLGGGSLVGAGTIVGNVASNGILATGSAPGKLAINGDLSLLSSSTLLIQIGGTKQGSSYDFFNVSGNATIGGLLDISMLNGVASSILSTDTFTILSSGGLSGAFANVGNGQRLLTADGVSSFQVNYGGGLNSIVLSNFEAVPEPSTYALMAAGLAIVGLGVRRRRSRQQQD